MRPAVFLSTVALAFVTGVAFAKMPPPSDAAKAAAAETAAKSAWTDKVAAYKLCQVQDRIAAKFHSSATATGKPALSPESPQPCIDPGPFAYTPQASKPLESSGAHSPPGTASSPPSTNAPAADIAGGVKQK